MENVNTAMGRSGLHLREKRKFNWLVLALLIAVIGVGAYWILV